MRDDEVRDSVEDLDPVPVRLLHAGEEAGVFERYRDLAGNGLQQLTVFGIQMSAPISKTESSEWCTARTSAEAGEHDFLPGGFACELRAKKAFSS